MSLLQMRHGACAIPEGEVDGRRVAAVAGHEEAEREAGGGCGPVPRRAGRCDTHCMEHVNVGSAPPHVVRIPARLPPCPVLIPASVAALRGTASRSGGTARPWPHPSPDGHTTA